MSLTKEQFAKEMARLGDRLLAETAGSGPTDDDALDDREKPISDGTSAREGKRPPLDHLEPGTVTDPETGEVLPLFGPGDRIICERRTELLQGSPWLDTRLYVVTDIDDDTGHVRCEDPEFNHRAVVSYRNPLHRIVLAAKRGNPFGSPGRTGAVRVSDPRSPSASGERKKRGRPKGSKNRPKEVIAQERAQRLSRPRRGKRSRR